VSGLTWRGRGVALATPDGADVIVRTNTVVLIRPELDEDGRPTGRSEVDLDLGYDYHDRITVQHDPLSVAMELHRPVWPYALAAAAGFAATLWAVRRG
jgi:hypothetical protein